MTSPSGREAGGFPRVILPHPAQLFEARALRCRDASAATPSLSGYLAFLGQLAGRQAALVENPLAMPAMPARTKPLAIDRRPPDPGWIAVLHALIQDFPAETGPIGEALMRLSSASAAELQAWAEDLLAGEGSTGTVGLWPFIAAALQVVWTVGAARLDAAALTPEAAGATCPACAALPVAGVLKTGGGVQGLRYLQCGLCGAEWHRPRLQCMHCGASGKLAYYGLEDQAAAVQAEACGDCRSYLKLIDRNRSPDAEPTVDDLATFALDVLMGEEGYARLGCNLFLVPVAG